MASYQIHAAPSGRFSISQPEASHGQEHSLNGSTVEYVTRGLSLKSIHSAMQSKCSPDLSASFGMKLEGLGTRLHAELVKLVKS